MIKIKLYDNIIEISGHANYDIHGKDIVCASISSIVTATVNYIMNIDSGSIEYYDDGNIVKLIRKNDNEVVTIILNTMIELFKDLESNYKKNIKIESEE